MWRDSINRRIRQRNAVSTDRFEMLFQHWPDPAECSSSKNEVASLQSSLLVLQQVSNLRNQIAKCEADEKLLHAARADLAARDQQVSEFKSRQGTLLEQTGFLQLRLERLQRETEEVAVLLAARRRERDILVRRRALGLPHAFPQGVGRLVKELAWNIAVQTVQQRLGRGSLAQTAAARRDALTAHLVSTNMLSARVVALLEQLFAGAVKHCVASRFDGNLMGFFRAPETCAEVSSSVTSLLGDRVLSPELIQILEDVAWAVAWFVADSAKGFATSARTALIRFSRQAHRIQSGFRASWRGVTLGGWLLLDPDLGDVWRQAQQVDMEAVAAQDEWSLSSFFSGHNASSLLTRHRETFVTEADFASMVEHGLNAVRIPIGYWVVISPQEFGRVGPEEEPYVGPALQYLDHACTWAEAHKLQIVIVLQGAPGGQNGESSCGHQDPSWHWHSWRVEETLETLKRIAGRYKDRKCVTGLQVMTSPSSDIPLDALVNFYEQSIVTIRRAGMGVDQVTIILPIHPESQAGPMLERWHAEFSKYDHVAFDFDYRKSTPPSSGWWPPLQASSSHNSVEHVLSSTDRRAQQLQQLPACVVGEWSISIPQDTVEEVPDSVVKSYADRQLAAYEIATHGWFFSHWPQWKAATRRGVVQF